MTIANHKYMTEGGRWENVTLDENTSYEGLPLDYHLKGNTFGLTQMVIDAKGNGYRGRHWNQAGYWDMGLGIERSLEMATEGWPNKAQYIQKLADKCQTLALEMPTQQIVREQYGPMWDMGAVVSGDPYCALNFREVPAPELVKIVINAFYSGSVEASALENRAAALAALALTLHTAGYAVEVTVMMPGKDSKKLLVEALVRNPGDVFDLERLAFWMGHPAAVRNVLYGAGDLYAGNNYGGWMPYDKVAKAIKKKCDAEGAIYIDSMFSGENGDGGSIEACKTEQGAMEWIQGQVDRVKKNSEEGLLAKSVEAYT
jgi:hypothetical protein